MQRVDSTDARNIRRDRKERTGINFKVDKISMLVNNDEIWSMSYIVMYRTWSIMTGDNRS